MFNYLWRRGGEKEGETDGNDKKERTNINLYKIALCTQCKNGTESSASGCSPCALGSFSTGGASACLPCAPGFYGGGFSACTYAFRGGGTIGKSEKEGNR